MTSDLHLHPLGDKYWEMNEGFSRVVLTDEDKAAVRAVVDWCCHERKLDAIALTDHDMLQSSLYAAEYVEQAALPIQIVPGAECTVRNPKATLLQRPDVHLLCLGLTKLPQYDTQTPADELIHAVHQRGGFVILSHPLEYPYSFFEYWRLLDGYEYRNSNLPPFDKGKRHVDSLAYPAKIRAFNNSDFHYTGSFPAITSGKLQCNYYEDSVY